MQSLPQPCSESSSFRDFGRLSGEWGGAATMHLEASSSFLPHLPGVFFLLFLPCVSVWEGERQRVRVRVRQREMRVELWLNAFPYQWGTLVFIPVVERAQGVVVRSLERWWSLEAQIGSSVVEGVAACVVWGTHPLPAFNFAWKWCKCVVWYVVDAW